MVIAVVAVLEQHATAVDGVDNLIARATVPIAKFGRRSWNVALPVRTEIVDHGVCVGRRRPLVARCAFVNFVDSDRMFALQAPIASNDFRANLEPTHGLPT